MSDDEPSLHSWGRTTNYELEMLFATPATQVANVLKWSRAGLFNFSPGELRQLRWTPPGMNSPTRTVPVLVPLADTIVESWQILWRLAAGNFSGEPYSRVDVSSLQERWPAQRPRLRWVCLDLMAWWDPDFPVQPRTVRSRRSAGIEVLAAAAHSPEWLRATASDTDLPFVALPGLRCLDDGVTDGTPLLFGSLNDDETETLGANVTPDDEPVDDLAFPTMYEL